MAFKKLGETKFYNKIEFNGCERYISKKTCVTPEPLGSVVGNHAMTVGEDSYPITVSESGKEGQYHITVDNALFTYKSFVGTQISPELIIIKDSSSDSEEGVITKVGGKVRVWIYDSNIFLWE